MRAQSPNPSAWEAAYERFETPARERKKFTRRLRRLGADGWPRDAKIVELFCGRGNGLVALSALGFTQLEGVDLSPELLAKYPGPHRTILADCRALPFADCSRDILIVQGGLHHLPALPDDLIRVLKEVQRVLRPGGCLVAVEPWRTPFLNYVHAFAKSGVARRLSAKVDALQTMIENEQATYDNWLGRSKEILEVLASRFETEHRHIGWGKLEYRGRRKPAG